MKNEEGRGKREEGRDSGIKTEDTSEDFLFSFFVLRFSFFPISSRHTARAVAKSDRKPIPVVALAES